MLAEYTTSSPIDRLIDRTSRNAASIQHSADQAFRALDEMENDLREAAARQRAVPSVTDFIVDGRIGFAEDKLAQWTPEGGWESIGISWQHYKAGRFEVVYRVAGSVWEAYCPAGYNDWAEIAIAATIKTCSAAIKRLASDREGIPCIR